MTATTDRRAEATAMAYTRENVVPGVYEYLPAAPARVTVTEDAAGTWVRFADGVGGPLAILPPSATFTPVAAPAAAGPAEPTAAQVEAAALVWANGGQRRLGFRELKGLSEIDPHLRKEMLDDARAALTAAVG